MNSSVFLLRPLQTDDEPFLWEMCYQAIYVSEGQPRPDRSILFHPRVSRYMVGWGRPGDMGHIAVRNDGIKAGAAWLRLFTGDQRGYGWVDDRIPELSIALLPEFRGQGLGTALMEATLSAAREIYPAVSLSVTKGNPAEKLYRRFGFVPTGEDEHSLVMVLSFSEPAGN